MTIIYPEDPHHWNGKLYITAHGAGSYGVVGTLVPRDPKAKFNPLQNFNRYVTLMIDQGLCGRAYDEVHRPHAR